MIDDTKALEDVQATPVEPTPETTETPALDAAALRAELEKVRREAAGFRTKLRAVEEQERAARAEADKTKPLEERLAAAEARALTLEVEAKANKLRAALVGKVSDVELAVRVAGEVGETDDIAAALIARFPSLAPTVAPRPAMLPGAPGASGGNRAFTLAQLAGMTPDEINAHWDAISTQLGKKR